MHFEHRAFILLGASRGAQALNGALYNSLTLNYLANKAADECGMIFGGLMQASSVVPMFVTTTLILDLSVVPFVSALLDGTNMRFKAFVMTNLIWVALTGVGALLLISFGDNDNTEELTLYFISLCLVSVMYEVSGVLHAAYLPEVAEDEDTITTVTSKSSFASSIFGIGLAGISTVLGMALDLNDKDLGAYAAILVIVMWAVCAIPGLSMFKVMESGHLVAIHPSSSVGSQEGPTVVPSPPPAGASSQGGTEQAASVIKKKPKKLKRGEVFKIFKECWVKYVDVGLFLFSYMLFLPAVGNLIVLATGFLQNAIGYKASEISMLSIIVVLVSAPAAFGAKFLQNKIGIKNTLVAALLLWTFCAISTPWVVSSQREYNDSAANSTVVVVDFNLTACGGTIVSDLQDDSETQGSGQYILRPTDSTKMLIPFFAFCWGAGIGMVFTSATALYASIIPGGREAGFFGAKTFAAKIIAWSPSLMYAIINESTGDLNLAMFSISVFFILSLPFILLVKMQRAKELINPTMKRRRRSSIGRIDPSGGILDS